MQALLFSVAALFVFAAVVAALPFLYAAARRAGKRESELQMWRVLEREHVSDKEASPAARAHAVRRCTFCPNIDQCDAWLAARTDAALADFCPNAAYIGHLKH